MSKQIKITLPDFRNVRTEQDIISEMIMWLHNQGCAVCVWTEEELRGVRPEDIESGMIEWGGEAILMNTVEEEEENDDESEWNKSFTDADDDNENDIE